jgi:hypothetical protein
MNYQNILFYMVVIMMIFTVSINVNVQGQREVHAQQTINSTDNLLETIIQQNERIIQQNDESAIQERVGAYIGVIALLVSLSLVIYGFQLSREGRITQKAKRHYHIIVLSLVVPVFILVAVAWFGFEDFLYPHYNIMASLLFIPGLIVIILMFKGAIVGDASSPSQK